MYFAHCYRSKDVVTDFFCTYAYLDGVSLKMKFVELIADSNGKAR